MTEGSIKVPRESDFAATIKHANETGQPITVDTGDAIYRVFVGSRTHVPLSADDVVRSRAAIRKAIGSWKSIDAEAFKAYITERRHTENRPSVRW